MEIERFDDWNREDREIWSGDKHGLGQLVAIATSVPFAKLIENSPSLLKAVRLLLATAPENAIWEHDEEMKVAMHDVEECGLCYARAVLKDVRQ